jgi:NAD(P)-dependent dehydrogenase (short-subunit alcohol dehydrogenase family)
VLVVDLHGPRAAAVAAGIETAGGRAAPFTADVRQEAGTLSAIAEAEQRFGPVDLFFANAGIGCNGGEEVPDDDWLRVWEINVMPHVHAARALIPQWLDRGSGYLVTTASAAALLTTLESALYATTKSAALSFAEWISIKYGDKGIKVSCLCPQGVRTRMTMGDDMQGRHDEGREAQMAQLLAGGALLEPDDVATALTDAVAEERFLVLPHAEVGEYFRRKAGDYERWLAGMRRLRARTHVEQ